MSSARKLDNKQRKLTQTIVAGDDAMDDHVQVDYGSDEDIASPVRDGRFQMNEQDKRRFIAGLDENQPPCPPNTPCTPFKLSNEENKEDNMDDKSSVASFTEEELNERLLPPTVSASPASARASSPLYFFGMPTTSNGTNPRQTPSPQSIGTQSDEELFHEDPSPLIANQIKLRVIQNKIFQESHYFNQSELTLITLREALRKVGTHNNGDDLVFSAAQQRVYINRMRWLPYFPTALIATPLIPGLWKVGAGLLFLLFGASLGAVFFNGYERKLDRLEVLASEQRHLFNERNSLIRSASHARPLENSLPALSNEAAERVSSRLF